MAGHYLLGGAGSEALKDVGVKIGTKYLASAVKQIPGRTLIEINKKVGFRLLTKGGTTAVLNLGKIIPLAGAPIGATVGGLPAGRSAAMPSRHSRAWPSACD